VDVLTGVIKANFPTRISFQVSSKTDSRTILDANGAEHLLGAGDMLFLPPGTSRLIRVHGAYVSEVEILRVVEHWKKQGRPVYDQSILEAKEGTSEADADGYDEMYDQAVALVTDTRQASISMIQRRLRVGYNRAARMIEKMEQEGVVGPADGSKPREVYARKL
jgi:S-DNA-T family DNA segregation ATPase FtsK/SpoIIIE